MLGNQDKKSGLEQDMNSGYLSKLENIRNNSGDVETIGLLDSEILKFVEMVCRITTRKCQCSYRIVTYHHICRGDIGC